jgi:tRNA pseudouridine55 synthase
MDFFGFLNIHKPPRETSRWVVDRVQRIVRPSKVGHAGTLDPLATGVVVVALGQATRLIEHVQRAPKSYRGTFLLGRSSDTEDVDGVVTELVDSPIPTLDAIAEAAKGMIGEIQQRPPAYSAVKVKGQRAYDLARAGKQVELQARSVQIYGIEIVEYAYPQLVLDIRCGGGTYVRTLGRELAERCGTCAVMSGLVRTAIGGFRLEDAMDVASLSVETIQSSLLPATVALRELQRLTVLPDEIVKLGNGVVIANRWGVSAGEFAAVSDGGDLVAILAADERGLRPVRYFPR